MLSALTPSNIYSTAIQSSTTDWFITRTVPKIRQNVLYHYRHPLNLQKPPVGAIRSIWNKHIKLFAPLFRYQESENHQTASALPLPFPAEPLPLSLGVASYVVSKAIQSFFLVRLSTNFPGTLD